MVGTRTAQWFVDTVNGRLELELAAKRGFNSNVKT